MRAVTSASNIGRRRDCPGSGFAEMGILDEETEYSAEGDLLHKLILARISKAAALDDRATSIVLTAEQSEALDTAEALFLQFEREIRLQYGIAADESFEDECEQTIIVRDANGKELYPGHSDLVRTWSGAGVRLVTDFKFGFLEVDEAPDNCQLASYGVGKYQAAPIFRTAVGIIQPRAFGQRLTRAVYDPPAIAAAAAELERIVRASRDVNAPRIAGERQCANCKAKLFCDVWKAKYLLPAKRGVRDVSTLSNNELWSYIDASSQIASIRPKLTAEASRRIESGEMEGRLQNTGSTKEITDLSAAWNRFKGFLPDAVATRFMACLKGSWGPLTEYTAELTGLPQKKARAKLEEMLGGLIHEEPKEPTPKRI